MRRERQATVSRVGRGMTVTLAAAAIAAAALFVVVDPATSAIFPSCFWRAVTGWLCPGCGSARAVHALVHGDVAAAIALNPLVVLTLPLIAIDIRRRVQRQASLIVRDARSPFVRALTVAIVAYGILRNLV